MGKKLSWMWYNILKAKSPFSVGLLKNGPTVLLLIPYMEGTEGIKFN